MRFAVHMMLGLLAAAVLGVAALPPRANAAKFAPLPKVTGPRLYVFDCGNAGVQQARGLQPEAR